MDLSFWKYKEGVYLDNQKVYETLSNEKFVEGVEMLLLPQILADIEKLFVDWEKLSDCDYESDNGAFVITTTEQFVRFDCSGMRQEDINKLIDVLDKYGCPLYDPQISVRFDGAG